MIGKRIKRLREEKGLSITKLARLSGVSKSYLSQIERELQSNPSLKFLTKVAAPLETNLHYLLGETGVIRKLDLESDLDEEWKVLIKQAIEFGLKKEDFLEYRNYLTFQNWMKQQKED